MIRLIAKWLSAGVMLEGKWRDDLLGTPQGAAMTPEHKRQPLPSGASVFDLDGTGPPSSEFGFGMER
ncbi:MAG: hypothetical protein OXI87_00680 [Albidovulum sp.]|nr:hypothetical protein [Albidovulum sp.]MDE0303388.1 hypothetical protein [Albidovulum sp.]